MPRLEPAWPVYFVTKALEGRRVSYRPGDLAEVQTKDYVRSLGPAFGVPDAHRRAIADLPYIKVLNVRSRSMAEQVKQQGLKLKDAAKLLGEAA
jgi:hypothetical protein